MVYLHPRTQFMNHCDLVPISENSLQLGLFHSPESKFFKKTKLPFLMDLLSFDHGELKREFFPLRQTAAVMSNTSHGASPLATALDSGNYLQ